MLFQCTGSVLAVYSGPILRLPWFWQVAIFLGVTALDIVAAVAIRSSERIAAVLGGALRWVAFGAPGVVLALIVFLLAIFVRSPVSPGPSCAEPVDLRVVANAEDVGPLTAAAGRYVGEKSRQGCRIATITVTGSPSIDELEDGFARGGGALDPISTTTTAHTSRRG